LESYLTHLSATLPEPYLIHRDFVAYCEQMRKIDRGELTIEAAQKLAPRLFRTSYCPCSKSIRWIIEEPAIADSTGSGVTELADGQ
jgi:hypothetical protein